MAPVRVRHRPQTSELPPRTPSPWAKEYFSSMPDIRDDDSFRVVVKKLSLYFADVIILPSTFEQLRTTSAGDCLRSLVEHLSRNCTNPAIVHALLALKWHYGESSDEKTLNEARANAAEIVAWRFLTHLSEREVIDYCLYEIPGPSKDDENPGSHDEESQRRQQQNDRVNNENSPLLQQGRPGTLDSVHKALQSTGGSKRSQLMQSITKLTMSMTFDEDSEDEIVIEDDPTKPFTTLNALEIAAVADAKRFLSQHVVQKIITGIWNGDIIFWDQLTVETEKHPRFYDKATADPFSRLRVPKYLKAFEVLFFVLFLYLYYSVLVERNPYRVSGVEILLYIWFAAFFYDELSEWIDAGSIFYTTDVWNLFDMSMMVIGVVFFVMRVAGLLRGDEWLIDKSFDVLSLEALLMVPRVCSILSLSPYWGTLIPCLKEMGKDFIKFMVLVFIIYLGFLTTFSMIGRQKFTWYEMGWILTKIFFGSSYVGWDVMNDIDPYLGPVLMTTFITLSSILLVGALAGMLSNSFGRVISHAREEYLYVYSIYVLEASTSNRLTHFYPPMNLIALVIFRPLRLVLPSDHKFRAARITLLKITHAPIVAAIMVYEAIMGKVGGTDEYAGFKGAKGRAQATTPKRLSRHASTRTRLSGMEQYKQLDLANLRTKSSDGIPPRSGVLASEGNGRPSSSLMQTDQDDLEAPSDTDVKIAELSAKIDTLTELVTSLLQQKQGK